MQEALQNKLDDSSICETHGWTYDVAYMISRLTERVAYMMSRCMAERVAYMMSRCMAERVAYMMSRCMAERMT